MESWQEVPDDEIYIDFLFGRKMFAECGVAWNIWSIPVQF